MGFNEIEAAEKTPTSKSRPSVFDLAAEGGHEQIVFCNDPVTGLKSIIAIHIYCALGATLNDETIKRLKCKIIAGGANNQLKSEKRHGQMLMEEGIVYCPDFLINAGGVINVYLEYLGNYKSEEAYQKAESIYDTCLAILHKSEIEDITPQQAATDVAMKRINGAE